MPKKNIPAGTYAFVTIPGKNEWAVLLNSDASKSYGDPSEYNEKTEVLRFSVPSEKTSRTVESLTIDFDIKNYDAIVYLSWENTQIHFLIETGSDALAMKYIDEKLANSNDADMLANAAFYYNMNGKDPAKAIAFLNKALSIKEDFWYYEEKMTALEKMKNFAEAKKTAAQAISYLRATKPDSWEKVVSRIEARVRKF